MIDDSVEDAPAGLTRLGGDAGALLIALCTAERDFFRRVDGTDDPAAVAAELLGPVPAPFRGRKHVFGARDAAGLTVVVELLQGHPREGAWFLGLLLVRADRRGRGTGAAVWAAVCAWLRAGRAHEVRVLVQDWNSGARRFWERRGFAIETQGDGVLSPPGSAVLHRRLDDEARLA